MKSSKLTRVAFSSAFQDEQGSWPIRLRTQNENPPFPDIRATVYGFDHFFELGEIVDEMLAASIGFSQKIKAASGCTLYQLDPLDTLLKKKCKKAYQTGNVPVTLLLYYWRQSPDSDAILSYLGRERQSLQTLLACAPFKNIWIYDWQSEKVLWRI